ncbi:dipeptidase [Pseudidiomarina woesei]|uniref:Zn-dependent dipeptidase, microsomal dipeptidase homolog n=1 Tax=Pseudidiomarina woesei TaxID=1381080 RepID=A0A0K6H0J1_9GAMM|nr:dipeptidase [Pseudidiomarina woesei]CUA84488.1 Zn-dependent dipeptidase, microsomal dipeptidase homolog [Pseudidiomarina woesei]
MNKPLILGLVGALSLTTAAVAQEYTASERAHRIAQDNLIIDTHIDVPYRLNKDWEDVTRATKRGDFDYPRAKQGGLNVPFMSVYIPAQLEQTPGASYQLAHQLIDSMEALAWRAPQKFAMAYSVDQVMQQQERGVISIALGMENGSPIEGDINNLYEFYNRGIRYITLAHSQSNHISDSSYDVRRQWNGLSPFGKELVKEMNNVGVMIDISHVSDEAFWQAVEISKVPVIASHSSLRRYTPGFERNMSDEMIKGLAKNGGVIMINFGSSFVTQQANRYGDIVRKQIAAINEQYGEGSEEAEKRIAEVRAKNPFPFATLEEVLNHIDHVKNLVGIEYIGIGSDYDGVGDSLPVGLKDVSTYPNLVQGLLDRGYSEEEIEKILYKNFVRVWREVETYAAKH